MYQSNLVYEMNTFPVSNKHLEDLLNATAIIQ